MSRAVITLSRLATRSLTTARAPAMRAAAIAPFRMVACRSATPSLSRSFGTTLASRKGLSPDSENPEPKKHEDPEVPKTAAPLGDVEYHELADEYLDTVLSKLEDVAEQRSDVDVEYSSGVLTLTFPPLGTYVINKQPPNKQIWLSSPVSGPKRYDWVIIGDGQNQKEGTAEGDWVYLRDGSTLGGLLLEELKVDVTTP